MSRFNIMPKAALADWVTRLTETYRVVGPTPLHGQYVFKEILSADELALDYTQTVLPPKKYHVPQRELLYRYRTDGTEVKVSLEAPPTVILGVHTCDLHAIRLFDRIFAHGFTDQHYQAHRENTIIVSYECLKPCTDQSFCRSMGTTSAAPDVFDLHMIDLGSEYCIEVGTEKGMSLVEDFRGIFVASDPDLHRRNNILQSKWERFPYRLDCDVTELPDLLHESNESEYWLELGDECLACGMCTQVCPTCYCFNIEDEVDFSLKTGERYRVWDSCQINEFAMVAGGHNFREKRAARQRHRFMRKGKYQFDANNMVGCVGCGRCATACLVHITPIKTFNELWRRKQERLAASAAESGGRQ